MKTKVFKKIGLLGLSSLATFAFASNVQAETRRCTYTNYYFFAEINHANNTDIDGSNVVTATYFPGLKGDNINYDTMPKGKICLKKNASDSGDGDNCGSEVWTLTEFYKKYIDTIKGGTSESDGKGSESKILETTDSEGNVIRYYVHGNWYKRNPTTGALEPQGGGVDVRNVEPSDLANGSYLPDYTSPEIDFVNEPNQATVTRRTTLDNWNTVSASNVFTDGSWCGTTGCKMAPALYKVTYEADCGENTPDPTPTPKYNATINYYYWDMVNDKKPTNPQKVPFKDSSNPNPFTRTDLANGYGKDAATKQEATILSPEAKNTHCKPRSGDESVTIEIDGNHFTKDVYYKCTYDAVITYCIEKSDGTCVPAEDIDEDAVNVEKEGLAPDGKGIDVKSPSIKNCKLKDSKQKTVTIKIDSDLSKATDFKEEVRYLCGEDIPDNPKTGIALIISAWVVGLGALGYSAYYFMNARKEENAEL